MDVNNINYLAISLETIALDYSFKEKEVKLFLQSISEIIHDAILGLI